MRYTYVISAVNTVSRFNVLSSDVLGEAAGVVYQTAAEAREVAARLNAVGAQQREAVYYRVISQLHFPQRPCAQAPVLLGA